MIIKLGKIFLETNNINMIDGNRLFTGMAKVELSDSELRTVLDAWLPKEKKEKNTEPKPELLELFEKLHKLTGGKGEVVFSLKREKKLNDLLTKERLTKDNLITAATNIGNDAFLQGDNDSKKRYGDVDYLLRPDKAAKWAEEQENKKRGMF